VAQPPFTAPIIAEPRKLRWRLTMVAMATTWSGSVACRMPRRNPRRAATQIAERFGHNTFTGIATPVPSTRRRLASSARPFRHARVFDGIAALTQLDRIPVVVVRRLDQHQVEE